MEMSRLVRAACAASAAVALWPAAAHTPPPAQPTLRPVVADTGPTQPGRRATEAQPKRTTAPRRAATPQPSTAPGPQTAGVGLPASGPSTPGTSLTVPNTEQARREIQQTPGAVAIVPDTAWKGTKADTIKDI